MKKFIFLSGFFLAALGAVAQVTIGSGNVPSEWSLLDIDTSVQKKGLHSPRLDNDEREGLIPSGTVNEPAQGTLIFNTETKCLEYWNSREWVSLCEGDDPCADLDAENGYTLCSPATVANLPSRIQWYAAATGGSPLAATTALATGSYYAGNCEDGVRQEVRVMLANCSSKPAAGAVTAWTNVMYDFQTQQLEAFDTPIIGGGDAVSFKWEVSTDGTNFSPVAGAPNSAFYTIPENYVHGFSNDGKSQELWFRCERTNPKGTTVTAALQMLNIITTDGSGNFVGGYGEQGGVKYLEITSLNTHHSANGKKVKIALTNLGATNDNNLGDFYQWGRVGDGHQVIGWTKSTGTRRDNIFDAATDANRYPGGTAQITGNTTAPSGLTLTSSGQVAFATNGFGKFIPAGSATYYDWSNSATRNNRWGNGSEYSNRTSDIAFSSWTFNGVVSVTNPDGADNNPCPGGWSVPSLWQWKDMHDGDGSSTTNDSAWRPANDAINDWGTFRFGRYGAVGGAVITNAAGEKVFLPAAGNRTTNVGSISGASSGGFYWSSTPGSRSGAHLLFFDSGKVGTFSTSNRAIGHSVRCVTEF